MGNSKNINQKELFTKVSLYLDHEMNREEEANFLQEIKTNPAYLEFLSKEKHFREAIRTRIQRRQVSPALVQSIKDKIRVSTLG